MLRSWRAWPLLEKVKVGGQYIAITIAAMALLLTLIVKLAESSAPRRPAAGVVRSSAVAVLAGDEAEEPAYSDLSRFDELEANGATVRELRSLLSDVETLPAARELLERLRKNATSRAHAHAIDGFITSTYHRAGDHLDGLEFLARVTSDVPLDDLRYRWQFHAHIRALAMTEGREEAERVIETFLRRTHRPELSRVWIGVPQRFMDELRAGETAHERKLRDEDVVYLLRLTQTHGDDAFIDHAHYAIGAYDVVIASHPRSLIRDAALRAALYRAVSCADDPRQCDLPAARQRLAQLQAEFPDFVDSTAYRAGHLLARAGLLTDAESFACPGNNCSARERAQMLDSALESEHVTFGEIVAWLISRDRELLERNVEECFALSDESLDRAAEGDYAGAMKILENYERMLERVQIELPVTLAERKEDYEDLSRRPRPKTAADYFQYGLAEMSAARDTDSRSMRDLFRENAAETFRLVERVGPGTEWAPKSCYLRASALRKLQDYDRANDVVEHFLQKHHGSPLYDDMLAEKGWHLLRVEFDAEEAEKVFEEVAARFPDGNAADNALTMLADSKWEECKFDEALDVYRRIIRKYPTTRLGREAQRNARVLASIVRTRRVVPGIRGLRVEPDDMRRPVVVWVASETSARQDGFLVRDRIRAIGDTHVGTVAAFYAAISAQQLGTTITVRVETPDAKSRFLRVRVQTVAAYDPKRVTSECQ